MMGGGGASVGIVQRSAPAAGVGPGALRRGYATVDIATGHLGTSGEGGRAPDDYEAQLNAGYRAVHLTVEAARSIVRHYYDRVEDHSYFVGCSRVAGQTMMDLQRYPDDFDGVVSGAPSDDRTLISGGAGQLPQAHAPDVSALSLDATASSLGRFQDAGGKIIFWAGGSEPARAALGTLDNYERLEAENAALRDYARLFMLPGVFSCDGGPGPDGVDWVAVIEDWVERERPPARVVAVRRGVAGEPVRTRPVCPYPEVAVHIGTGSTDDEGSYRCEAP